MIKSLPFKGTAFFFSFFFFFLLPSPAFAYSSPNGLSFLTNAASGAKLLANIELSQTPGLFLKSAPSSTPLPELVMSPIEATKSPNIEVLNVLEEPKDIKVASLPPAATTPAPSIIPTSTHQTISPSLGGLNADVLFSMVNAHRASMGLPAFQKDDRACSVAQARAPEVLGELYGGVMHQGLKNMNLPYWNTENIISMRTNEEAFNWWIHDEIHKEAIEGSYKYSCVACSGNSCAEEFTNFTPK